MPMTRTMESRWHRTTHNKHPDLTLQNHIENILLIQRIARGESIKKEVIKHKPRPPWSDEKLILFQKQAKAKAMIAGFEDIAEDFASFAVIKFMEGRRATIKQLLIDFLRANYIHGRDKRHETFLTDPCGDAFDYLMLHYSEGSEGGTSAWMGNSPRMYRKRRKNKVYDGRTEVLVPAVKPRFLINCRPTKSGAIFRLAPKSL